MYSNLLEDYALKLNVTIYIQGAVYLSHNTFEAMR